MGHTVANQTLLEAPTSGNGSAPPPPTSRYSKTYNLCKCSYFPPWLMAISLSLCKTVQTPPAPPFKAL